MRGAREDRIRWRTYFLVFLYVPDLPFETGA